MLGFGGGGTGTALVGGSTPITASGGTKSTVSRSGYVVHTFTHPSPPSTSPNTSQTFVVTEGTNNIEILVVAGGAGGAHLGGGAAGGVVYNTSVANIAPGTYPIAIGAGGAKGQWAAGTDGSDGGNSAIINLGVNATAYGGGGGTQQPSNPHNGGSGGGGNAGCPDGCAGAFGLNPSTPAPVIGNFPLYTPGTIQGYPGGIGSPGPNLNGGGGGGAGGVGVSGNVGSGNGGGNNGFGGPGRSISITGSAVLYGGGGGGGAYSPGPNGGKGNGGPGGGGAGAYGHSSATDGADHLGGGGGGAGSNPTAGSPQGGGSGGPGVVIIAYTA